MHQSQPSLFHFLSFSSRQDAKNTKGENFLSISIPLATRTVSLSYTFNMSRSSYTSISSFQHSSTEVPFGQTHSKSGIPEYQLPSSFFYILCFLGVLCDFAWEKLVSLTRSHNLNILVWSFQDSFTSFAPFCGFLA